MFAASILVDSVRERSPLPQDVQRQLENVLNESDPIVTVSQSIRFTLAHLCIFRAPYQGAELVHRQVLIKSGNSTTAAQTAVWPILTFQRPSRANYKEPAIQLLLDAYGDLVARVAASSYRDLSWVKVIEPSTLDDTLIREILGSLEIRRDELASQYDIRQPSLV